jgi:hypothetical protein
MAKYSVEVTCWTEIEVEADSIEEAKENAEEECPMGWDCETGNVIKLRDEDAE